MKAADKPNLSADDMAETGGAASDTLKAAMRHMQTEGLTSGEIVDHLVVAYCGRLQTEATLSDDEKAKQVSRFASRLVAFLYTAPGNEEDMVVDVSVPTPLYQRLQKAAKKAGVSEDAWVNQAITSRLASPDQSLADLSWPRDLGPSGETSWFYLLEMLVRISQQFRLGAMPKYTGGGGIVGFCRRPPFSSGKVISRQFEMRRRVVWNQRRDRDLDISQIVQALLREPVVESALAGL